ncbi:peptidyl-prolyl cis-trans isomerase FKBP4-like [Physella acuta]|uniref:peptidyl-prolyl cis-trans isomerase FKBP4-like n=1 Tax=Physella acuta TaxID=109671 RepID=UPI0027DD6FE0|nr:peptidyl-prolyl cis-trans isomerase FKBP4-like [Physella acuta]
MDNAGEDVTSLKDGGVILHKLPAVYPEEFDTVSLRYSLLHDGQIIEKDTEVTFVIDETEDLRICPGLEIAVKKLQVFEQARVLMTAEYGFGSEGHVALNVPPGAQIEYEIQVLALSKAKKISDLDVGQRLGLAEQRRVNATALSRIKCYKKAAYIFKSVLEILDNREDFFVLKADKKRRNAILLEAYVGLASCDLFLENFQEVIEAANSAIALSNIGSAYFRRAQAHQKLFLFKQAMLDYEKVIAIEPLNEAAAERLEECRIQLRKKCLIENSHQLVRLALQTAESQVPVAEAASKRALNSPLSTNPAKKAKLTEAHASDEIVEREDFLLKEMSALSEVFPENDPNELYAMLENAVDKEDRIILVINELFSTANYVELEGQF